MQPLCLHHEISLLAIHDDSGVFVGGMVNYAIAGAILSDLLIRKRIQVSDSKRQMVSVCAKAPAGDSTGNALIDEVLQTIASNKKEKNLKDWVTQVAGLKNLAHRVAEELCDLRILRADQDKILWLFPRKIYPEVAPKVERNLKDRMAKLMFGQTTDHNERTTVLVALAKSTGLLSYNFDKDRLRRNKDRIEKISNGDMFAIRATKSAVTAVQTAIMVAVMVPVLFNSS